MVRRKKIAPRIARAIYLDRTRSQYQLAELYGGISQSSISLIRSGRRHAALTKGLPLYMRKCEDFRSVRSGRRKLKDAEVRDIYTSYLDKHTLAKTYGIHRTTVEKILRGVLHRRLTEHLIRLTSTLV
jgi:DNA invertase Pin-like site-specific DNA recombinase